MSALQIPGKAISECERGLSKSVTSTGTINEIPTENLLATSLTSEMKVPNKPAPTTRPTPNTLPNRHLSSHKTNSYRDNSNQNDTDTNPLHILRDKNYRIIRPRIKVNSTGIDATANVDGLPANDPNCNNQDEACESPSYLTNTQYTFSERDVNIHNNDTQKFIGSKEIENLNPIPLPPRDRNKVLLTNVKRHVRKHPLIIPASGLQRTLNKVVTPLEDKCNSVSAFATVMNHDEIDGNEKSSNFNKINYNMPRTSTKPAEVNKMKQYTSSWYVC